MSRKKEQTTDPPSEATLTPTLALVMMAKSDYDANGFYANAPYKLFTREGEYIGKIEERSDRDPSDANKSIIMTRLVVIRPAIEIDFTIVANEDWEKRNIPSRSSRKYPDWVHQAYLDEKRKNR